MAVTIRIDGVTYTAKQVLSKYKEIHDDDEISVFTVYHRMRTANNYNELFRNRQEKLHIKKNQSKIPSTGDELRYARKKNNEEFWKPFNKAMRVTK